MGHEDGIENLVTGSVAPDRVDPTERTETLPERSQAKHAGSSATTGAPYRWAPSDATDRGTPETVAELTAAIAACRQCADAFAATATAHAPRPVPWLSDRAPILIAGQAPGAQVHAKGRPFDDRSGDRLRDWLGVDRATFYDRARFAVLPMAFCFPGYDAAGADLPPPPVCARLWRARALAAMPQVRLILLVGGHAQVWHLGRRAGGVAATVRAWTAMPDGLMPLPHPSWRNTGWLRRNPWFGAEVLPDLRRRVSSLLASR